MKSDIWRLYRHILIGGAIILLVCYVAIELIQKRHESEQNHRLMSADAYLAAHLFAGKVLPLESLDPHSRFQWRANFLPDMPPSDLVLNWAETPEGELIQVYNGKQLLLEGVPRGADGVSVASLLRYYLETQQPAEQKVALLQKIPYVEVKTVDKSQWVTSISEGVDIVDSYEGDLSVLWLTEDGKARRVQLNLNTAFSLSIAVVLIVIVAVVALLTLIWVELSRLDQKRVHFETVTRQIARGRSSLPQGVVDSSGTLKELAYSFDSMSSHIQRLLKVQREMINAISHELRTPIARLRFGLEALKDDVNDDLEPSVSALEIDVEELNTLVDEVLTYGKLEEGSLALNFERTSITQLLNGIVDHNQSLLQKFDVRISVSEDDIVNADAHHLHRALQNLILNASKYANSIISITFTADEERWQVDIEDDGPGIPVEDRDKVFIPFQRLDNSRTRASGGYGLGLAIVQRIAFWHGGAVLVDGSDLGGAKFSLIWSRSQHQHTLS